MNRENKDKNEEREEIRLKRTQTLIGVWNYLTKQNIVDGEKFKLSIPLVNEIVQHYLMDMEIMKHRYRIKEKIQLYKIAGLMSSLILRYRPIVPLVDEYKTENDMYANELLAIIHGLSICSEYDEDVTKEITQKPWFQPWLDDFIFLLHHRNHTPESLIFVFETLSFFCFPKNMESIKKG